MLKQRPCRVILTACSRGKGRACLARAHARADGRRLRCSSTQMRIMTTLQQRLFVVPRMSKLALSHSPILTSSDRWRIALTKYAPDYVGAGSVAASLPTPLCNHPDCRKRTITKPRHPEGCGLSLFLGIRPIRCTMARRRASSLWPQHSYSGCGGRFSTDIPPIPSFSL